MAPQPVHTADETEDEKAGDGDRQQGDGGELGVEREEDDHHRRGDDESEDGLGHAVGDEVLYGLDVVDGARDEIAGALAGKESMRQALHVPVDAHHQLVEGAVGGLVGEPPVAIARGAA